MIEATQCTLHRCIEHSRFSKVQSNLTFVWPIQTRVSRNTGEATVRKHSKWDGIGCCYAKSSNNR